MPRLAHHRGVQGHRAGLPGEAAGGAPAEGIRATSCIWRRRARHRAASWRSWPYGYWFPA
eukprot:10170454-Heterocapsa_arctica.AAC.1